MAINLNKYTCSDIRDGILWNSENGLTCNLNYNGQNFTNTGYADLVESLQNRNIRLFHKEG